jgi:hypothetical protein
MSQIDPLLKPDEEEEGSDRNTQRAFFAGVFKERETGGLGYTNAFRGLPSRRQGGRQTVKDEDTIGAADLCWCGQPEGHSWPGKPKKPHPRGDQVSAMADEHPYLNPRDLKAFDRKVARALCALVNEYGVQYRITKGTAVLLIAPHSTGQDLEERLRVSAQRKPEDSLRFIERWATRYVRPAKVEEAAASLAEKFNDPNKKPHPKAEKPMPPTPAKKPAPAPVEKAAAPEPEPAPSAPQVEADGASGPSVFRGDPPEGYEQYFGSKGEPTNWWKKTDENHWLCKDCTYEADTVAGMGGHGRAHSERAARASKAMGKQVRVKHLLMKLAEEAGVDLGINSTAQTRKMEALQKKYDAVVAERDDLKARLELIKEGLRA